MRCALSMLVLSGAMSGCFPFAVPPSRTDIGTTVMHDDGEAVSGMRVQTGAHLASGSRTRRVRTDVGVGYIYQRTSELAPRTDVALMSSEPARGTGVGAHGGYAEVSRRIAQGPRHRTWLGVRAEHLWWRDDLGDRGNSLGVTGRVDWELFGDASGAGATSSGCGFGAAIAHGAAAAGVFVESGARRLPDGGTAFIATAGVSVRLPFIAGFVVDFCPR